MAFHTNQPLGRALAVLVLAGTLFVEASGQVFIPGNRPKPEDPGADAADVDHKAWKWEFEPLSSGFPYTTELTIENLCESTQIVSVFVNGLAELTFDAPGCNLSFIDKSCTVAAEPGTTIVKGEIKSDPFFYYVDPMVPTPRPFKRITGEIVVFHARQGDCVPRRDHYQVQYDLGAQRGAVPPPPTGPQRIAGGRPSPTGTDGIAGAGPCQVWWDTGQKPDMLKPEQRCEPEIRPLAVAYRERVLPPYIEQAPAEWAWLPASEQMTRMSSEELVAMKLRAKQQIAR